MPNLSPMKTAIVTGTSRGIGLAVVNKLLNEGCKVVGWARSKANIQHDNYLHLNCDVSKYSEVEKTFNKSMDFLGGKLDILVNNAGFGLPEYLVDSKPENFEAMMATNVNGLYYCSKFAAQVMTKAGSGHIFNIASIAGTTGIEAMSAYCASKFAVRGFSLSIYKELRKQGVKVSCINPGSVNTNFFDDFDMVEADDTMLNPNNIADAIWQSYTTPSNYHMVEMEIRPIR